jgi:N-acyl-D-aspartate/D-glutamate deacylase
MRRSSLTLLALVATVLACGKGPALDAVDLLIVGGTVVDGTGDVPRRIDVAVDQGRIVALGPNSDVTARRVIDATGQIVAPGFVDMHSHADLIALAGPRTQAELLEAKIRQGVTTIVVGNCGLGVAPTDARSAPIVTSINGWMTPDGVISPAMSVGEFLEQLDDGGVVLNVATLVPHGPVRISAMGLRPGEPTATELEAMSRAIEQGLVAGAFGLSTGLIYPPGMYSSTDELVALARVVARHDGLFTSHVRGSSETLLDATRELVEIARSSGVRAHHSHMEAVGEPFWQQIPEMLAIEDAARDEGLALSHDVFLYTRAATMMAAIFPPWSLEGGVPELLARLGDAEQRERIRRDIEEHSPAWPPWVPGGWPHNLVGAVGWDGILVASVGPQGPTELVGRSLADIAADQGSDPFEVVVDLLVSQDGRVGQQVAEISGREGEIDALLEILNHPAAAVISDAEDYGGGAPHPAHAGAFARALRLNRQRSAMALQEIVRRMSGYPASLLGLEDRGVVQEGKAADLVIFDPLRVNDRATWTEPRESAEGILHVVINGTVVVEEGRYLGGSHGSVLRSGSARLSNNRSPSGVSANTSTILLEASPSP